MGIKEYLDNLQDQHHRWRSYANPTVETLQTGYSSTGEVLIESPASVATGSMEETYSLYHRNWNWWRKHPQFRARNVGGPFFNRKLSIYGDPQMCSLSSLYGSGAVRVSYSGPVFPTVSFYKDAQRMSSNDWATTDWWTSDNAVTRHDLVAEGLKLLRRAMPTTPAFNAAVALGELREGLFQIPGKGLASGNPGSEFLNYQFGILPTTGDAVRFYDAVRNSSDILRNFRQEANTVVRRRRFLPERVETSTTVDTHSRLNGGHGGLSAYLARNGKLTTTTTSWRSFWFAGEFRYYYPPQADKFERKLRDMQRLYGFAVTPLTIWQLTPFSWLLDWFANVDDVLFSVFHAGSDGTVVDYAYVMCHSTITTTYDWTGDVCISNVWRPAHFTWSLNEEIKQREAARAYGVEWTGVELTPKQLAILTALGISRR